MKKNVAGFDKIIRIIAGFVFVIVGIFAPVGMGWCIGSFSVAGIAFVAPLDSKQPMLSTEFTDRSLSKLPAVTIFSTNFLFFQIQQIG